MELKILIKEQIDKLNSLIDNLIIAEEEKKAKIKDLVSMQRIIRGINEILIIEKDEKTLFESICDLIITYDNIKIALIAFLNGNKDQFSKFYIKGGDNLLKLHEFSINDKVFMPFKTKEIYLDNNYVDKIFNDEVKSVASIPIFYDLDLVGVLAIFSKKESFFFEEILMFLKEISGDISLAIRDIKHRKKIDELLNRVKNALFDLSISISKLVELKDPQTINHGLNVGNLAIKIGEKLNLDKERLELLCIASILHDIGKITVPTEILNKPSKLTNVEYNLVKLHPQIAYDYLKDIKLPLPIGEIILQHHERENGSGYPNGLKKDEILLEAKIISVAEVVHAMCSFKPYRPAYKLEEALNYIKKESGNLFNKEVVDACIEVFKEGFSFI